MKLQAIATPLIGHRWVATLQDHPDRAFARYICQGINEGFRIGFNRTHPLQPASSNMQSVEEHPEIVTEYIDNELSLG